MRNNLSPGVLNFGVIASNAALAAVYFYAGKFGLSLAFVHASVSAVWPPSGIALAALLLWGYRLWPGIFVGAFLVNITTQGSVATTLGIAAGNTLEALLGAWFIQRFANGVNAFGRSKNIFKFVLLAAILSTSVSATLGVTSLSLGGFARWDQVPAIWLTWWLGDMVGDLLVTPLIVIWMTDVSLPLTPKQILEAGGLLLTAMVVGQIVFLGRIPSGMEYLAVLPLLWAAFRFGERGAATFAFIISGVALLGTLRGFGPFATSDPNQSLLLLQAFMGTVSMTSLVLAAVISERRRAEQRLHVQNAASRILAESPALREAAAKIVQVLCEGAGWELGAIWNVDRTVNELTCVEVWHPPFISVREFEANTRRIRFARGVGLPGRVWDSGKPVWVSDVTQDANLLRASVALKEGLHAGFGFPIKLGDETLGVIECFSRDIREPDDHFLQMVGDIGGQLGNFIERKCAEEALGQAKEELAKSNQELESRVKERTAELEQAHAVLLKDIEAQKKLEEQLRQAQKLESIGTLAAGVAHDFNNILNIIKGYAALLAEHLSTDRASLESLEVIDEAIERGASTVRQMLVLARKTDAHLTSTSVNDIGSELTKLIRQTFPKNIDISLDLDPRLPLVMADANQIRQALLNLCVNARDAMPNGGRLTLRTLAVDGKKMQDGLPGAKTERYVCIEIMDSGAGMDESVRDRIFEPFFTTKKTGEGTGLGLAIVYGIVKSHQGFIDVESKLGRGTTFRLYLPNAVAEEQLTMDPMSRRKPSGVEQSVDRRGTILVVEDEENMVRLLKGALSRHGYRVLTALDGQEAIDLYHRHGREIDAVLLDLGLSKIAGWDVMLRIRQENPKVKIIVASGNIAPELKSEMHLAGVHDFFHKPYVVEHIVERLAALIEP